MSATHPNRKLESEELDADDSASWKDLADELAKYASKVKPNEPNGSDTIIIEGLNDEFDDGGLTLEEDPPT